MKIKNIWVIAESASARNELLTAANSLGEEICLVSGGSRETVRGAGKAYWIADGSFLEYVPAIVELVKQAAPNMVICEASRNGRLIAGILSAQLRSCVQTDITELELCEDGVHTARLVYGGAAFRAEKSTASTAVLCVGGGLFPAAELEGVPEIRDICGDASGVSLVETRAKEQKSVNLAAAKTIVAVGRGCASEQSIDMIRELASVIGAEVGCTRPVAEDEKLMEKELYIGVSGAMLKPEVYMGIGVSGQVQHMVGVNQAGTLIAINKDKAAPIFSQCDYGLIANAEDAVPLLIERLKK